MCGETMKKYFFIILSVGFVCFHLSISSANAAEDTYQVGTDSLNIRKSPDQQAEVIGQLSFGDHLVAFDEKHGWVKTYYAGEEVWVASQFLFKTKIDVPKIHETEKQTTVITANSVRLRSGPGTNYRMVGSANKDDSYKFLKKDEDWVQIQLDNGDKAWVARPLTQFQSETKQQNSNRTNKTKRSSKNGNQPLAGYNIMIDPGHGGSDPGSTSLQGTFEKEYTLKVAKVVAEELEAAGATVILTRYEDTHVSLVDRVALSHAYLTHAFISLHYDAYTSSEVQGVSTHYFGSSESKQLATSLQRELSDQTGFKDRGVMDSPYYILRNNDHLAILIELGFLTNSEDLTLIEQKDHPDKVAKAIKKGMVNYFK